jgi:hypothetical protein
MRRIVLLAVLLLAALAAPAAAQEGPQCSVSLQPVEAGTSQWGFVSCTDAWPTELAVATAPAKGEITIQGGDSFSYAAGADVRGEFPFTLDVTVGGEVHQVDGTAVVEAPDKPGCYLSLFGAHEHGKLEAGDSVDGVLECFTEDALTITPIDPEHGSITEVSTPDEDPNARDFTYTADETHEGTDLVAWEVARGSDSWTYTTTAHVRARANDAPTCYASFFTTAPEVDEDVNGQLSCRDDEGDEMTPEVTEAADLGEVTFGTRQTWQDGTVMWPVTYAAGSQTGTDQFTVGASDGTQAGSGQPVTMEVGPAVDDAPSCSLYRNGGGEAVEVGSTAQGFFTCHDPDGPAASLTAADTAEHGDLTLGSPVTSGPYTSVSWTYKGTSVGTDTLEFTAKSGAHTVTKTIDVEVGEAVDDPPSCYAGLAGQPLPGPTLKWPAEAGEKERGHLSCTDEEGHAITLAKVSGPAHGTLTVTPNPPYPGQSSTTATLAYEPDADFRGEDSFTVSGTANGKTTTVEVDVVVQEPVDQAPVCNVSGMNGASISVEAGRTAWSSVSCTDDEGQPVTPKITKQPGLGTLTLGQPSQSEFGSYASLQFAAGDATGSTSFELVGTAGGKDSAAVTVQVTVTPRTNQAPQCSAGIQPTAFREVPAGRVAIEQGETAEGWLSCWDADGEAVTYGLGTAPGRGSLTVEAGTGFPMEGRELRYTPKAGDEGLGDDELVLTATDGKATTTRTLQVTNLPAGNDPPQCGAELWSSGPPGDGGRSSAELGERERGYVSCWDDEDGQLAPVLAEAPQKGEVVLAPPAMDEPGRFTYEADALGHDQFGFEATDAAGVTSARETVLVDVVPAVDSPISCYPTFGQAPGPMPMPTTEVTVEAGEPVTGSVSCYDEEGKPLSASVKEAPAGDLTPVESEGGDGRRWFHATYTGKAAGEDRIVFEVTDGTSPVTLTIDITVTAADDDPPLCTPRHLFTDVGTPVEFELPCSDPEGQPLTGTVTTAPDPGTVTGPDEDGLWTYEPAAGFGGQDDFVITVSDGGLTATASITVTVVAAAPLALSPQVGTPEATTLHTVVATVREPDGTPVQGRKLLWSTTGVHERSGTVTTDADGQAVIAYTGDTPGDDVLEVVSDVDGDGEADDGEPVATAEVRWTPGRTVEPPTTGTPTKPGGGALDISIRTTVPQDNPTERYFIISRSETTAAGVQPCDGVPDSRKMDLPVSAVIDPGGSTVKDGSVQLIPTASGAANASTPLAIPGTKAPASVSGQTYRFVLDCVRTMDLWVRYTLQENGAEATYTVPIGGLTLIDPQGVVYDRVDFDAAKAAGRSDDEARADAAIVGAEVTLQRRQGDTWTTVLSGDPGISPKVNPQTTGLDGKFQWDVEPGEWRVVVSATGYEARTSEAVTIPPPKLDLHMAMERTAGSAPPQTTIDAGPPARTKLTTASVEFGSSQQGSTFECRLDDGAWAACTSPHALTGLAEGSHTLLVRARNGDAVDGTPASRTWVVDTTPPQTTIDSGPPARTASTSASGTFSSSETGSTFECRLDGSPWQPCTSPVDLTGLAEGAHTAEVRAVDAAGNADATPATRSWTVDVTAPNTVVTGPSGTTNDDSPSFGLTATEGPSTFECRLDGGAWGACSTPKAYTGLADGSHVFEARATDDVGNADATPAQRSFVVDTAAPAATITSGPSGTTPQTTASFGFASEPGATFECRLDAGEWAACTTPHELTGLAQGAHTFDVRAKDGAGNTGPSASRTWTVGPADTTAPQTTITQAPPARTFASGVQVEFASSEAGSTFECRLGTGDWAACTSPKAFTDLAEGSYTAQVRATDAAGNTDASPAGASWVVDRTGPDTAIVGGPDGLTTDASPLFGLTSPEAGATFECRLDSTVWTACTTPKGYADLADGEHLLYVRAKDDLGNPDSTPAARSFTVDRTAPVAEITSGPSGTVASGETSFGFSAEPGATFECKLDEGPFLACASPRELFAAAGEHTFQVRARDAAGNTGAPATRTWTVGQAPAPDTTAPDTTITDGPAGTTTATTAAFTFGSEAGATFECRVDAGAWGTCTSPRTLTGVAAGAHTFEVRATDGAGNTDASPASRSWTVEAAKDDGGGATTPPPGGGTTPPPAGGGGQGPAQDVAGTTQKGCAAKAGAARTACLLAERIAKTCGKLKGKAKTRCTARVKALAKCEAMPTKGKKAKAKRSSCLKKARKLPKK